MERQRPLVNRRNILKVTGCIGLVIALAKIVPAIVPESNKNLEIQKRNDPRNK